MVAAATGSILSCDLPLCAKGVRRIAGGQASPRSVIAAGNYIYWVNYGVMDVDGGIATSDAALMRVHK